jgi:hypothetical protein
LGSGNCGLSPGNDQQIIRHLVREVEVLLDRVAALPFRRNRANPLSICLECGLCTAQQVVYQAMKSRGSPHAAG